MQSNKNYSDGFRTGLDRLAAPLTNLRGPLLIEIIITYSNLLETTSGEHMNPETGSSHQTAAAAATLQVLRGLMVVAEGSYYCYSASFSSS